MVVRPSDWFLVGFAVDPTPGDAFGIRGLAQKYADIAAIAGEASTGVRNARSSASASAWVGDAAEVFRDRSSRMPGELLKANDSYQLVADALRTWAESVDDTQAQADRGLQQAREAHHDLVGAQAALGSAELSWLTVHAQQLTYQTLVRTYSILAAPAGVTMPTDYQLRSVDRNAQQAQTQITSAKHAIASADARLAAAKSLVVEAKTRRDDAERLAVHQIHEAMGQAVKPSSIWEAITSSAAWSAIVTIATVVLTIVSIVAIFVGGPLVWALIIAATVLLLADALMKAAQGQDMTMTIVLLLVGLIPGGRALTSAAKIADVFRSGTTVLGGLGKVAIHLGSVSKAALVTTINSLRKSAMGLVPGITSAIRSFPAEVSATVGSAREGAPVVDFVKDMVGGVKHDYSVAADHAWNDHLLTMNDDPARVATLWQSGGGGYHNADPFTNTASHAGQIFEQGFGGPASNFMLADGSAASRGLDLNAVADGAQIGRSGPDVTLRSDMLRWMTPGSEPMATAIVGANTAFGHGGLTEGFFTDLSVKISEGRVVPISVQNGLPLNVEFRLVTNKAMDIFGAQPWVVESKLGDRILLTGDPNLGRTVAEEAASFGSPGLRIGFRLLESALGGSYNGIGNG